MDRNVRALIIALLCVFAVSLAAATLANPQQLAGQGPGSGDAAQPGETQQSAPPKDSNQGALQETGRSTTQSGAMCGRLQIPSVVYVIGFLAIGLLTWFIKRRDNLWIALAVLGSLTAFLLPVLLWITSCNQAISNTSRGDLISPTNATNTSTAPGGQAGGEATNYLLSPPVLLAVLVIFAVVFAVLVYRASGNDTTEEDPNPTHNPPTPENEEALAAVGAAAGNAADRIENTEALENEVFRAWRTMTDHVALPDPETSTPQEFADAARDAGMAAKHVDTLTDVFRDVRYGGVDATENREQRAVKALRAIEEEYATQNEDRTDGGAQ